MNDSVTQANDLDSKRRELFDSVVRKKGIRVMRPPAIQRRKQFSPCDLSFAQQRLWFLQNLEPESTAYNVATALRLQGTFNVTAFELALNALIERHEILR